MKRNQLAVLVAAAALLACLVSPGSAHEGGGKEWPCQPEAEKFCKDVEPGGGRIVDCLKGHEGELSKECRASWEEKKKDWKDKGQAEESVCREDQEQYCKDVEPGGGRVAKCMLEHREDLSPGCREAMEKKKDEWKRKAGGAEEACGADKEKFCKEVEPGEGRIIRCMLEHKGGLSAECAKAMGSKEKGWGGKGKPEEKKERPKGGDRGEDSRKN